MQDIDLRCGPVSSMARAWCVFLLTCSAWTASGTHWPAWRGPHGDGKTPETNLPLKWGPAQNVRWRTPLPERGNSTPIVWGQRVFVTQPVSEGDRRTLICLDRADGKILWQSGVSVTAKERLHKENTYASASPVTDGERVVCWFGSGGVAAYDFSGTELWRTDLGPYDHPFGYGSSPVIYKDFVFLNFGPGAREFLVALDKKTGKELWRYHSPVKGADNIDGSWATPVIVERPTGTQLINAIRGDLAGLDPATGKLLWRAPTAGLVAKCNPQANGDYLIMEWDKEHPEVGYKFEHDGTPKELWRRGPAKQRVGSPVIHQGMVFSLHRDGLMDCAKVETGEIVWNERLKGPGANTKTWSSPVLSEDRLYVMNQSGDVFIIRAADRFEVLAVNSLGEPTNSSVVPSNGQLFLRTHQAVWCIGAEP